MGGNQFIIVEFVLVPETSTTSIAFYIFVDSLGVVDEANENNNIATRSIPIVVIPRAAADSFSMSVGSLLLIAMILGVFAYSSRRAELRESTD